MTKNIPLIPTNFQDWHSYDVEQVFNLKQINHLPAFKELIAIDLHKSIPEALKPFIATIQQQLSRKHIEWNEAELNFQFIAPLLATIGFNGDGFSIFIERKLVFEWQQETISGVIDFMVSNGFYKPEQPYFFLHEYKRFKGSEANPLGQLLIAMIAAQHYNNDQHPIYGCFVVSSTWRFVVLDGQGYAVSKAYDASDEQDLYVIWNILYHIKQIIEERVQATFTV